MDYSCEKCGFLNEKKNSSNYYRHIASPKHIKLCGAPPAEVATKIKLYECKLCGTKPTAQLSNFQKHLESDLHKLKEKESIASESPLTLYTHKSLYDTLLSQFEKAYPPPLVSYCCGRKDCTRKPCYLCMATPMFFVNCGNTYFSYLQELFSFLRYTTLKYENGSFILNGAIINITVAHFLVGFARFVIQIMIDSKADALRINPRVDTTSFPIEFTNKIGEIRAILDKGKDCSDDIVKLAHTFLGKLGEIEKAKALSKLIKVSDIEKLEQSPSIDQVRFSIPKSDLDEYMKALALTIAVKEKVRDYSIVAYERYREQSEKEKSWNQEGPRKKKGAYVLTVEECMPSYERENEEEVEEKTLTREDMENQNSDEEEEHVLIQRTVSDNLSNLELQMNIASKFDAELRETEDGIKKCFLKQKTTSNVKTMVLGVVKCVQ